MVSGLKGLSTLGVNHFQLVCLEPKRVNIVEIVNLDSFFPFFVLEDDN